MLLSAIISFQLVSNEVIETSVFLLVWGKPYNNCQEQKNNLMQNIEFCESITHLHKDSISHRAKMISILTNI